MKMQKVSAKYAIRHTLGGVSILEFFIHNRRWMKIGKETSFQAAEKFIGVMCSADSFIICSHNRF